MMYPNSNYPGLSVIEHGYDLKEVEREFRAQIERVIADVPQVSHISGHMGSIIFDEKVNELVNRLAKEYNLSSVDKTHAAKHGYEFVSYADGAYGMLHGKHKTLAEKEESFINMLKSLKPGKKYMFIEHPAYNDVEMENVFILDMKM